MRTVRVGIILIILPLVAGLLVTPYPVAATPVFSDTLDNGSINPAVWNTKITGTGPIVAAVNQSVITTLPANSQNDPVAQVFGGGLESICFLGGDFDMQINFKLILWPQSSGVRVGLVMSDAPTPAVERTAFGPTEALNLPREVYLTHFADGVQGITGTTDLNGTLRMVRTGSVLSGYYLSKSGWALIHSGPTINAENVHFGFSAWSHNALFGGQEAKVGFNNFVVNSGQLFCPSLSLSPTAGPVGTKVQVQASGFPFSSYGPDQVIVSLEDTFLGIATNTNGTFSFTFNVPDAQPGLHLVKVLDELSGTSAATIYTLATLSGTPLNSTTLQLQLTLMRPDGSNTTLTNTFIGGGLFRAAYTIPKAGPIGTYAIIAKAHVASAQDVSVLTTFEVKPTWLSTQGPALVTTAIALTGAMAVMGISWRKGIFRNKID